MKTLITILIFPAMALGLNAQSSGGSPGSHAANNGGFSQPPVTVPSAPANTPSAANPNASRTPNNNNFNPNINGTTPGMTNGAAPPVTNSVDAFGDTNNSAAAGFNTNSGMAPGAKFQHNGINPQSPLNRNPNMNTDGDVTNANGTMTFNTNSPHWWEKKD